MAGAEAGVDALPPVAVAEALWAGSSCFRRDDRTAKSSSSNVPKHADGQTDFGVRGMCSWHVLVRLRASVAYSFCAFFNVPVQVTQTTSGSVLFFLPKFCLGRGSAGSMCKGSLVLGLIHLLHAVSEGSMWCFVFQSEDVRRNLGLPSRTVTALCVESGPLYETLSTLGCHAFLEPDVHLFHSPILPPH